ncbi:unnamed protein product [Durusdinium trenchii]|uniref:Uncharacterized protein n=1 Tax=Durusdinium trenchii TaxID=1381693 RepID=A0ABP0I501_9DINO
MGKPCFQAAAELLKQCQQEKHTECAGAATWSWGGDGTCHARNLFVTWELSCCDKEQPERGNECFEAPKCEVSPSEAGILLAVAFPVLIAGLLLLLRCCFKQRQAREVSPEELQAFRLSLPFETEMSLAPVAHSDPEKDPLAGGPPSHWGGGIALPAPANPRKEYELLLIEPQSRVPK